MSIKLRQEESNVGDPLELHKEQSIAVIVAEAAVAPPCISTTAPPHPNARCFPVPLEPATSQPPVAATREENSCEREERPVTKTRAASSTDVVAKLDLDTEGWESGEEVDLELTGTLRRRRLVKARGRQCMEEALGEAEFELANTDFMAKRCSLLEQYASSASQREERRGKRKAERFGSRAEQKKKERGEIETVLGSTSLSYPLLPHARGGAEKRCAAGATARVGTARRAAEKAAALRQGLTVGDGEARRPPYAQRDGQVHRGRQVRGGGGQLLVRLRCRWRGLGRALRRGGAGGIAERLQQRVVVVGIVGLGAISGFTALLLLAVVVGHRSALTYGAPCGGGRAKSAQNQQEVDHLSRRRATRHGGVRLHLNRWIRRSKFQRQRATRHDGVHRHCDLCIAFDRFVAVDWFLVDVCAGLRWIHGDGSVENRTRSPLAMVPSSYGRGDNIAMALNLQTAACGGGDGAVGLSFEYMLMRPRAFLSF
uniref:Uncharacterized protein n=1 Tax=Oryza sativa subsp. japonica TaxID=39947 RepID=Q5W6X1_ORYSJ|nr:hypothetical protein [Oryza sativa Japonica Group]